MFSLCKLIKKSLLLRDSPSTTPLPNPDATTKASPFTNTLSKTLAKRWNQVDLSYSDPHLDKVHGEGEIVLVRKDVYYKKVMFFIQCFQSLVTF